MLFVGSCFAESMGKRFQEEKFRAVVNPFGVMYNPASILHTVERYRGEAPQVAIFTLGTNRIYRFKETGEIVDNCQKRPQSLFNEEKLSVEACVHYLCMAVETLQKRNSAVQVIVTVSPIRYRKYGYHGSQLSKAILLLAADAVAERYDSVSYFPAYELVNDELRDYRFYKEDMLHPSDQAVKYIWQRFGDMFFGEDVRTFLKEWRPIKEALKHRPFRPKGEGYIEFIQKTKERAALLSEKYGFDLLEE